MNPELDTVVTRQVAGRECGAVTFGDEAHDVEPEAQMGFAVAFVAHRYHGIEQPVAQMIGQNRPEVAYRKEGALPGWLQYDSDGLVGLGLLRVELLGLHADRQRGRTGIESQLGRGADTALGGAPTARAVGPRPAGETHGACPACAKNCPAAR